MKRGALILLSLFGLCLVPGAEESFAQDMGAPRPGPIQSNPLPPPAGAQSSGGATLTQEPSDSPSGRPAPSAPPSPAPSARPTLVPNPGDPLEAHEVTLPARPAAILSGSSSWDEGFDTLKNDIKKLEDELGKAGIQPAGRPVAVFVETDDMGFRYDLMVPVAEQAAQERASLTPEIRFGRTPDGKAYHFVHKGPYDDIDSTYETITAYLDSKGIIPKDAFIEEYVTDLTTSDDDNLEINIFVQPR